MDDLVAMLRELNPLLGHGGGKTVNEAADAIERLSAENAALKSDLRVAGVSDSFYKLTVAQRDAERITNDRLSARIAELERNLEQEKLCRMGHASNVRDSNRIIEGLDARIAALESGQPVPHRGEMWQLVRVEPSAFVVTATRECLGQHVEDTDSDYRRIVAAMLTASAQEMHSLTPQESSILRKNLSELYIPAQEAKTCTDFNLFTSPKSEFK